jgi:hypothetical protein
LTPSRRYHILARYWYVFLLLSAYLGDLAAWLNQGNCKGVVLLFGWSCLLLASTCPGEIDYCYRCLHQFSFTGLAAVAVLLDLKTNQSPGATTAPRDKANLAPAIGDPAAAASAPPPVTF